MEGTLLISKTMIYLEIQTMSHVSHLLVASMLSCNIIQLHGCVPILYLASDMGLHYLTFHGKKLKKLGRN
jgi:hypothetical protein